MRRLIFWLLIFAGISSSVPPVRERVAPRVAPIRDYAVRELAPHVKRGLDPVYRWSAVQEMRRIARELRQRELSFVALPHPREFQKFLEKQHYTGRKGLDPWGSPYYLILKRDSIIVGSPGPDLKRGTEDDIREAVYRR